MSDRAPRANPHRGAETERPESELVDLSEIALEAASAQVTYQAALETNAQVLAFSVQHFLR
ncbi:MAG TPA: hypothetical protein VE442_18595 [Jatrophihabitans sp.]|nr:hypothetical protein [Jatrophihabitans sp.]